MLSPSLGFASQVADSDWSRWTPHWELVCLIAMQPCLEAQLIPGHWLHGLVTCLYSVSLLWIWGLLRTYCTETGHFCATTSRSSRGFPIPTTVVAYAIGSFPLLTPAISSERAELETPTWQQGYLNPRLPSDIPLLQYSCFLVPCIQPDSTQVHSEQLVVLLNTLDSCWASAVPPMGPSLEQNSIHPERCK